MARAGRSFPTHPLTSRPLGTGGGNTSAVTATGALQATGVKHASGSSAITGTGAAAGTGTKTAQGTGALSATCILASAQPTIVQQVAGTSTNDYGFATVSMTSTEGNTLVVLAGWDLSSSFTAAAMPAVNVTDSAGNHWVHVGTSSAGNTGSRASAWICVNALPITWLSVSLTSFACSLAWSVLEVSGLTGILAVDVAATNSAALASSLTVSPGSATTADIAFSVLAAGTAGLAAPATPSGWTALNAVTAGGTGPSPVQIFPFWNAALAGGSSAATAYPVAHGVPLSGVTFAIQAAVAPPQQPSANFPLIKLEAGFGATPGDPSQAPPTYATWTDITSRLIEKDGQAFLNPAMGRAYELAQMEAGKMSVALRNDDGALTPTNASSPFWPNVALETPVRASAFWQGRWYFAGSGWVERWPQDWPDLPQFGISKMIATDAVSVMAWANMVSALDSDMLLDSPYVLIPGAEQYTSFTNGINPTYTDADAQGNLAANISRVNQRPGVYVDGTAATAATGQSTQMLGDPDSGFGTSNITTAPTVSASGPGIIYTDPNLPGPTSANGVSVEFWLLIPSTVASTSLQPTVFQAFGPASAYRTANPSLSVQVLNFTGSNSIKVTLADGTSVSATFNTSASPQQVVLTVTSSSLAIYVNGAQAATKSLSAAQTTAWSAVTLGCCNYAYASGALGVGNFTAFDWGIYGYVLPSQRILSHYSTGALGQQGVDATQRVAQILSWANLGLPRGGQVLFGGSPVEVTEGPAYSLAGQSAADAVNQLVTNEAAMAAVNPSGALIFIHKWALFNQSPVAAFGDANSAGAGQIPYQRSSGFDYDNTYLANATQVTQQVGPNTTMVATANDFGSQHSYYLRSALTQTIQTTSPQDAISLANWLLAKYSQPQIRVRQIVIDAAANPAAFATILALQQGQVATVTRSPIGGAVISETCLIQKITHQVGPAMWRTSVELSPYSPQDAVLTFGGPSSGIGSNTLS